MRSPTFTNGVVTFVGVVLATSAFAQLPCPAGQVLAVTASAAGGNLFIAPNGAGQTFAGQGTVITVCITCNGVPLAGLPANQVSVDAPGLNICPVTPADPSPNFADGPTDTLGCTTFSGTIFGGGCAPALDVLVAGAVVATLPIFVNSPDTGLASPGFVDASDLAAFAPFLATFTPCLDFNGNGPVDAPDIAILAALFGASCP